MRRLAALAAAVILTALLVPLALADVEFDEGSQAVFGFDADGVNVEGADGDAEFEEAWELFSNSVEGARILGKLDGNRDWEIVVRARPGSEFEKDGKGLHGLSILFKHPNDDGQRRVEVDINTERTGGVANLADTIYHEFRHVENWIDGSSEEERDKLHAGTDGRMNEFLVEIGKVREKPLVDHTPIYDAIFGRSDDTLFRYAALDLGEILTNDSPRPESDVEWDPNIIAIDDLYIAEVTEETIEVLDALIAEQAGCGDWGPDTFGCGGAVGPTVSEGDTLIGVGTLGPVPYEAPDEPWMFWLGIETDGDSSNNFGPGSGFDSIYEGTDRHYRMFFDPATGLWGFGVEQRDADGTVTGDSQSSAFGFIQDDVAWFVIPDSELLFDDPRIRVALAGFDGSPIIGVTAYDPNGELPTDPLIGLDGSRAGGQASGSASTDDGTVLYYGPTTVPAGGVLDAEFCLTGADGNPTVGADFFATLGEPPSSASATHNSGTTDLDGCVRLPLDVNTGVGETNLRFSTGFDAVQISSISILDTGGSVIPFVSPEEFARLELYRWIGDLFEGVVTTPGVGGIHEAADEMEDQDNPFFGGPIDQRDTILPAWDVIGFHLFSLGAIDTAWPAGDGEGVLRALPPNPFYEPVNTGYTAAWFQMASPLDEWEGFGDSTYQCFVALAGLDPSRPTTIPASVGDDLDPARDTNFSWAMWVSPNGSAFTTKTEVNPETRVALPADTHATLGAIREWTDFVLLIPTEDLTNIELLKPSAGCVPQEYTDYSAHTRDVLDPITPETSLLSPYLTFGTGDEDPADVEDRVEPEPEDSAIDDLTSTTLSPPPSPPTTLLPVAVGRPGHSPAGDSDALALAMMAFGVAVIGAGAWAFRKASTNVK